MSATFRLIQSGKSEDILVARGMRNADNFVPGLQEAGRRFGVAIEFLPESGFDLEYTVKPPLPRENVTAFAALVTALAVDAFPGSSFPSVRFMHQAAPSTPEQMVFASIDLVS